MKIDKIFIASDHAGFDFKAQICELLNKEQATISKHLGVLKNGGI